MPKPRKQKTSERLKEIQAFVELKNAEMAILLGLTEQMYELYISGRFDKTEGIRQKRVLYKAELFLDEEIDREILKLLEAKKRFENYNKAGRKSQPVTHENSSEKPVTKNVKS